MAVRAMNKEQFLRKWEDTHGELSVLDKLECGRRARIKEPSDKNITVRGKIPGKALIEKEGFEKRANQLSELLLDAAFSRATELMDIPMEKLTALAIRSLPQQIAVNPNDEGRLSAIWAKDQAIDAEFTEQKRIGKSK